MMENEMILVRDIIAQYESVKNWERWPEIPAGGKSLTIKEEYFRQGLRDEILGEIEELSAKKLVYMEKRDWVEYKRDPIRVRYQMEDMGLLYELAGVEPKWKRLANQQKAMEQVKDRLRTPWILEWMEEKAQGILKGKPLSNEALAGREKLYQCMIGLDYLEQSAEGPMLVRAFSKRFLGNSKIFKSELESIVIAAARRFHPEIPEDRDAMADVDVLEQLHLEMYSQELTLKGSLRFRIDEGKVVDTADYPYGLVLNQQTLSHLTLCDEQDIQLIRTIENKANFVAEPYEEGKLVIFSHGHMTPTERRFLAKLRGILEMHPEQSVRYEHSGDLDFGGICIYRGIREKVFPELQPYRMDIQTYDMCVEKGLAEKIDNSKAKKIGTFSDDSQLGELAARLAKDQMVVEQEAYL